MNKLVISRKTSFTCRDGSVKSIGQCLVRSDRRPKKNWVVSFMLNGFEYETEGGSWQRSMGSLSVYLKENKFDKAELIAASTCNLAWLKESEEANRLISADELEQVTVPVEGISTEHIATKEVKEESNYIGLDQWGASTWDYMGWDLSFETTTVKSFRELLTIILNKLHPDKHPSRGCIECWNHFKEAIGKYDVSVRTVGQAKAWLNDTHNIVNKMNDKKEYTYKEASNKYGW